MARDRCSHSVVDNADPLPWDTHKHPAHPPTTLTYARVAVTLVFLVTPRTLARATLCKLLTKSLPRILRCSRASCFASCACSRSMAALVAMSAAVAAAAVSLCCASALAALAAAVAAAGIASAALSDAACRHRRLQPRNNKRLFLWVHTWTIWDHKPENRGWKSRRNRLESRQWCLPISPTGLFGNQRKSYTRGVVVPF